MNRVATKTYRLHKAENSADVARANLAEIDIRLYNKRKRDLGFALSAASDRFSKIVADAGTKIANRPAADSAPSQKTLIGN